MPRVVLRAARSTARAASRASARCSALPFVGRRRARHRHTGARRGRARTSTRSTRETAASIDVGGTRPRWNASRYGRCWPYDDWNTTSSPASNACCAAVAVFGSVMCSTVAPPVADASEITKPGNPSRASACPFSRCRFCVAGEAVDRVVGGHDRPRARLRSPRRTAGSSAPAARARCSRSDNCRARPRRRSRRSASASRRRPPARTPRRTRVAITDARYGSSP